MADTTELIMRFYRGALTVTPGMRPAAALDACLTEDFTSVNLGGTKSRAALAAQLEGFWTLVPDLDWAPQEVIASGDRCVVRSIASGSPRGMFMGLALDGSRSFRIDTIDILTIRDGRIAAAYHLEDWASAITQLKAAA